MTTKCINAQDVYDEDYPPGTERRRQMDAKLKASVERFARQLKRRERVAACFAKLRRLVGK